MNIFNRRRFLKTTSLAFSALGLNMVAPTMFQKRMEAAAMANNKKLIFIFLQGGNDGINTILPRGDAMYNTTTRPTLFIPEGERWTQAMGLHSCTQPCRRLARSTIILHQRLERGRKRPPASDWL